MSVAIAVTPIPRPLDNENSDSHQCCSPMPHEGELALSTASTEHSSVSVVRMDESNSILSPPPEATRTADVNGGVTGNTHTQHERSESPGASDSVPKFPVNLPPIKRKNAARTTRANSLPSSIVLGNQISAPSQVTSTIPPISSTSPPTSQPPKQMTQAQAAQAKRYSRIVHTFEIHKPFAKGQGNKYPPDTRCVYCGTVRPESVLFPCRHKCVCDQCMRLEGLSKNNRRRVCPVCNTHIQLVLPHTGKEEEQYWEWIAELSPPLPRYFKDDFKESAKWLRNHAVVACEAQVRGESTGQRRRFSDGPLLRIQAGARKLSRRATTTNAALVTEPSRRRTEPCTIL